MASIYLAEKRLHEDDTPIACVEGGKLEGWVAFYTTKKVADDPAFAYNGEGDLDAYAPMLRKLERAGAKRGRNEMRFTDILHAGLTDKISPDDIDTVYEGMSGPQHRAYTDIYNDFLKRRRVVLPPDGKFRLLVDPDPKKRQVYYVPGKSGAGKSHICRMLATSYKHFFPRRDILLFSDLDKDETLDSMKIAEGRPSRIRLDTMLKDPPSLEESEKCMSIFDDYDTVKGDKGDALRSYIDEIATKGRHTQSTMVCASHHLTNYSKTSLILSEATQFVVFPQATGKKRLVYLLEKYASMDPAESEGLQGLNSRWVCIGNACPPYLVSEHEARIVSRR